MRRKSRIKSEESIHLRMEEEEKEAEEEQEETLKRNRQKVRGSISEWVFFTVIKNPK